MHKATWIALALGLCPMTAHAQIAPAPGYTMTPFYQTCLASGGSPGSIVGNSSGGAEVKLYDGETTRFSISLAQFPNGNMSLNLAYVRPAATGEHNVSLIPYQTYSASAKSVRITTISYPGASIRMEYCFRLHP